MAMTLEAPRRIAVVRALPGLGDLLCAVPALRALRRVWPAAHVTLIGLPAARPFVARFRAYVDAWLEFPGWPGIPERPHPPPPSFVDRVRADPFDLALQLHGSGAASTPFTRALGARHTAGFVPPGTPPPDPAWFVPYPAAGSEIHRCLALLTFLGIPPAGAHLEFPVTAADRAALGALGAPPAGTYACLHPGASLPDRRWPAARFARVADALAARGLTIVLTGTPGERDVTRAAADAMRAPALDLDGRTDVGALAALLAGARLVVTNDTGVSHLAAAVCAPSVVVFVRTDPARWAPLDGRRHRAVGGVAETAAPRARDVPVDAVVAAADDLLRQAG